MNAITTPKHRLVPMLLAPTSCALFAESVTVYKTSSADFEVENGNPKKIRLIEEFKSMEQIRQFAELRELRSALKRAGTIGEPEFRSLTRVSP